MITSHGFPRGDGEKMALNNCKKCGNPVRLRGYHITLNRKRGVAHYIEHMDGSAMHSREWDCIALKPYLAREEDRPSSQLIKRWNEANV